MNNSGTLVAIDKAKKKMKVLEENLAKAGCTFALVYSYDSSKAAQSSPSENLI